MGLEQHWEAHCNKCGNGDRLLPGAPKARALALGWVQQHTQKGTEWFCPACVSGRRTEYDNLLRLPLGTSPNGLTYGCQACWDDINGDAHEAHCHRSSHGNPR